MKHNLEAICHIGKHIIEDKVRITIYKLNIGEYLMALLMPQYNVPTLSKMDFDTLLPTMTSNIIINDKYETAY